MCLQKRPTYLCLLKHIYASTKNIFMCLLKHIYVSTKKGQHIFMCLHVLINAQFISEGGLTDTQVRSVQA